MIDTPTQHRLNELKRHAERNGLDYEEVLDLAGLLLTAERRNKIQTEALEILAANMDNFTDAQIAGQDQTVTGAVRGCKNFIEMHISMRESQ